MPTYDFRCPKCGLEFEVSRPISRATEPALCPTDKTESERIFIKVAFMMGRASESSDSAGDAGGLGGHDHGHGHSHGPGGHSHSHGAP